LISDSNGNLYGTNQIGGDLNCWVVGPGCGTVFKVDSTGQYTVLHTFTGTDGATPRASLILDPAGNLYGTTSDGGASGVGTVFKLDAAGKNFRSLHSFTWTDGAYPWYGMIWDKNGGNLYGTTNYGGASGNGTVFKLDSAGQLTVLYSFTGGADGAYIFAPLIRDAAGNLYGTACLAGAYGWGTIFKLDSNGVFTVLYSFTGGADGAVPRGGLTRDAAGNLYGTTESGGSRTGYDGWGTVFKVDSSGWLTVLHTFTGTLDGAIPRAPLLRDNSGNLYGTAEQGGNLACGNGSGCGTVFVLHQ
jgi:uncharacterized repeat protein (TIGR03803 family)